MSNDGLLAPTSHGRPSRGRKGTIGRSSKFSPAYDILPSGAFVGAVEILICELHGQLVIEQVVQIILVHACSERLAGKVFITNLVYLGSTRQIGISADIERAVHFVYLY